MSTLFFDGFDRGTLLKRLDPNYWKLQLKNYPQYAFGAYTYDHTAVLNGAYVYTFDAYSPNGGTLPLNNYIVYPPFAGGLGTINDYPAYGRTPGFLALTNIPINQSAYNLTPLSYIALTGFPSISGTKSYFGIRYLGIETKDTDYHASDALIEGRFGAKHPLLAFCSGNTTGLILNLISVTGDTLLNLRQAGDTTQTYTGKKITIGLQVEQHGNISGTFDLNLGDTLSNYRITPIYCGPSPFSQGSLIPISHPHKILTIADTDVGPYNTNILSRWTHFEFEIDHTGNAIRLKVEDADALVINPDESDRELWDISIGISGFYYDNIRIFNRTYNTTALSACTGNTYDYAAYLYDQAYYYRLGALTLIDDVTLVDNTGLGPTYFLGKNCKVLPLNPGFGNTIFTDAENTVDGPLQWSKSSNISNKAILSSFDKDNSYIYTSIPNETTAIVYSNSYYNSFENKDANSTWRYSYNDGIAGMKVYNYARKEFLDTSFRNVIAKTGLPDPNPDHTIFLIHADEIDPILDYSKYSHNLSAIGSTSLINNGKFNSGLSFSGSNSLVVATDSIYDFRDNAFTVEAWIKLNSSTDNIILLDRKYRSDLASFQLNGSISQDTNSTVFNAGYRISVNTGFLRLESFYYSYTDQYFTNLSPCATPATMDLILPSAISTGQWHHIAITKNKTNTNPVSGYFTVFLNGISGTGYYAYNIYNGSNYIYDQCPGAASSNSLTGPRIFPITSDQFYITDPYSMHFNILSSKYTPTNSNSIQIMPYTYFGGSGCIDELKVSSGLVQYSGNFTPRTSPFVGPTENFIEFGPTHSLTRTYYKLIQYYQMYHPETLAPFTSGQIIPSGIKLGVKKL
jgi:frataxin-like iron-binding protein CyaY